MKIIFKPVIWLWEIMGKEHNRVTIIISFIAILCSIFIPLISICNFQSNIKISEANYEQSFRPFGTVGHSGDFIVLNYDDCLSNKPFHFCYSCYLVNTGNGVLSYLGNINHSSKQRINFRKDFLNNKIKSIVIDKTHSYARKTSLQKNQSLGITLICESDSFFTPVYFYSLIPKSVNKIMAKRSIFG